VPRMGWCSPVDGTAVNQIAALEKARAEGEAQGLSGISCGTAMIRWR
jgi:hypothetical protein